MIIVKEMIVGKEVIVGKEAIVGKEVIVGEVRPSISSMSIIKLIKSTRKWKYIFTPGTIAGEKSIFGL